MIAWLSRITTAQWLEHDEQSLSDGSHGGRPNVKNLSMLAVPPEMYYFDESLPPSRWLLFLCW